MARARYSGFYGQHIGGSSRPGRSEKTITDTDPYSGEELAQLTLANKTDVDEAYRVAAKAQAAWAQKGPDERRALLLRVPAIMDERRDEIIDWLIRESGSTRIKAECEWSWTRDITLEAASFPHRAAGYLLPIDVPGKESRVYRRPVGVVGVITPWNFPLYLSQRSVAPAIALGNSVVLKPPQDTPITGGLLLGRIYEEAGLPPGVLDIIVGDSRDIGDAFVQHPVPATISFTGSTKVGRHLAALVAQSPIMKRLMLELGGNSPLVVLDDADVGEAVRTAIFGRYLHQGQICMSSNRIIVDTSLYDEFVERFAERASRLKFGNPQDPDTVIGPIINAKQLGRMLGYMEEARSAGARQVLGAPPNGLVLPPHVFAGVASSMAIARNETFGPIASIIRVSGEERALRAANDTEYGLSSAVCTRDHERGLRFAQGMHAGMTHINDSTVNDSPNAPFGGEKNSGFGRFGGEWILNELTTVHWVTVQHTPRPYPF